MEVCILTQTDNAGILCVSVYKDIETCLDQVRQEFDLTGENFTDIEKDDNIKKLSEDEYLETPKMRYRIDICKVNQ